MSARAGSLDTAIAQAVQEEIQYHGGRRVSVKSITDYMQGVKVYSDSFWQEFDAVVSSIRGDYTEHVGNIKQNEV